MSATPARLDNLLLHPAIWRAADARRDMERNQQHLDLTGISSGYSVLDQALPDAGWPDQGMAELLCAHWACGEAELLAPLLRQLSAQPRWLVWVNPPWLPFAPALARQGVTLENTLLLRCAREQDVLWTMEQCLGSGSCSLVQGWPANPQPAQIRRLQLAAKKGHALGLLLRPAHHAQQPSPAPLRLELAPLQEYPKVRILKCPGHWGSDWLTLHPTRPYAQDETLPMGAATTLSSTEAESIQQQPPRPPAQSRPSIPSPGPQPPGG